MNASIGKLIIIAGIILVIIGLIVYLKPNIPFLGKLPGDIRIEKENFKFYFPIMTSILLSIVISFILYVVSKMGK